MTDARSDDLSKGAPSSRRERRARERRVGTRRADERAPGATPTGSDLAAEALALVGESFERTPHDDAATAGAGSVAGSSLDAHREAQTAVVPVSIVAVGEGPSRSTAGEGPGRSAAGLARRPRGTTTRAATPAPLRSSRRRRAAWLSSAAGVAALSLAGSVWLMSLPEEGGGIDPAIGTSVVMNPTDTTRSTQETPGSPAGATTNGVPNPAAPPADNGGGSAPGGGGGSTGGQPADGTEPVVDEPAQPAQPQEPAPPAQPQEPAPPAQPNQPAPEAPGEQATPTNPGPAAPTDPEQTATPTNPGGTATATPSAACELPGGVTLPPQAVANGCPVR